MSSDKMNVITKERELTISRTFDAPRELVFEVFSSCEHLKHWWGTQEWPIDECFMDFREGGTWHYCLRGPNEGDESWGVAVYQKIKKPEKLMYKDHFSDEDGSINEEIPGTLITVEFIEQSGRTKLISHTLFDTPETLQSTVEMGVIEGLTETWDRLEEHLAKVTTTTNTDSIS